MSAVSGYWQYHSLLWVVLHNERILRDVRNLIIVVFVLAFLCLLAVYIPMLSFMSLINIIIITDKFDVLRGRLLGNHNDFHWQLGGQINHQPCSYKAARVIRCTELDSAVSSF